ncbi:MAG: transcriptional repressor, partial [Candidatus Thermoplasmatota archaeon]|nr:transcriptional repressor [Candidatus Thermoplasmatota archaeon]
MEIYVNILKKNNLKITHQRLEILKYLDLNLNHPTAEEIYTYLKKTNPGLSRTTVYNTLEKLSDVN